MALRALQHLTVGKFKFRNVLRVETTESRDAPIKRLEAILPRFPNFNPDEIQQGDKVVWRAGYREYMDSDDPETAPIEFEGEVREVGTPTGRKTSSYERVLKKQGYGAGASSNLISIVALDRIHRLNWLTFARNYNSVSTDVFLQDVESISGFPVRKQYSTTRVNGSGRVDLKETRSRTLLYGLWLLRYVKRNGFGVDLYYRDGAIVLRDPGDLDYLESQRVPVFVWSKNIISDDLVVRPGNLIKVRVRGYDPTKGQLVKGEYPKGTVKDAENERLRRKIPPDVVTREIIRQISDDYRTVEFDVENVSTTADAEKKAEQIHEEIAGDGFTGSLVTFGFPRAEASSPCLVVDPRRESRTKLAIVNMVEKWFDVTQGFRQRVYPGAEPVRIYNRITTRNRSERPPGTPPRAPDAAIENGGNTLMDSVGRYMSEFF